MKKRGSNHIGGLWIDTGDWGLLSRVKFGELRILPDRFPALEHLVSRRFYFKYTIRIRDRAAHIFILAWLD